MRSLVVNHPFIDGNKRVGHAAMETFLILNGYALVGDVDVDVDVDVDDAEKLMLNLAAGEVTRGELLTWITSQITARPI